MDQQFTRKHLELLVFVVRKYTTARVWIPVLRIHSSYTYFNFSLYIITTEYFPITLIIKLHYSAALKPGMLFSVSSS